MVEEVQRKDIKLERQVGRGGFGLVYKAIWKTKNNNEIAVKVEKVLWKHIKVEEPIKSGEFSVDYKAIWKTQNNKKINVRQFKEIVEHKNIKKEVKSLLHINHENIVKYYGIIKNDELKTLILMEYIDGGSLYDFLHGTERERKYSCLTALNWMLQCAKGLAYLHEIKPKVLHRDLNTKNLLLANNFRTLKICDFGNVRELATRIVNVPSTAQYMAPEVGRGEPYTEMCDVYSFGNILWEVVSREKPYIQDKAPPLEDVICKHSNHIKTLIQMCWNEDPSLRPTMKELAFTLGINPTSADSKSILKLKPLLEISDKDFN